MANVILVLVYHEFDTCYPSSVFEMAFEVIAIPHISFMKFAHHDTHTNFKFC